MTPVEADIATIITYLNSGTHVYQACSIAMQDGGTDVFDTALVRIGAQHNGDLPAAVAANLARLRHFLDMDLEAVPRSFAAFLDVAEPYARRQAITARGLTAVQ